MRYVNKNIVSASDAASVNSSKIDSNQLIAMSLSVYFGDTHAAGTFKLQASNDICTSGNQPDPSQFLPTNWVDIPNQSATITAGAAALLTISQVAYRWVRAVYASTANYKSVQSITTVADVAGSLKSTYFNLYSVHSGAPKRFYVWLDNGSGVDPAVPSATGVRILYSDNASANTLATLIRAALNALPLDFVATGATNQVIATNVENGAATAASDGAAPTGFTITSTNAGVNPSTINVDMFALSL